MATETNTIRTLLVFDASGSVTSTQQFNMALTGLTEQMIKTLSQGNALQGYYLRLQTQLEKVRGQLESVEKAQKAGTTSAEAAKIVTAQYAKMMEHLSSAMKQVETGLVSESQAVEHNLQLKRQMGEFYTAMGEKTKTLKTEFDRLKESVGQFSGKFVDVFSNLEKLQAKMTVFNTTQAELRRQLDETTISWKDYRAKMDEALAALGGKKLGKGAMLKEALEMTFPKEYTAEQVKEKKAELKRLDDAIIQQTNRVNDLEEAAAKVRPRSNDAVNIQRDISNQKAILRDLQNDRDKMFNAYFERPGSPAAIVSKFRERIEGLSADTSIEKLRELRKEVINATDIYRRAEGIAPGTKIRTPLKEQSAQLGKLEELIGIQAVNEAEKKRQDIIRTNLQIEEKQTQEALRQKKLQEEFVAKAREQQKADNFAATLETNVYSVNGRPEKSEKSAYESAQIFEQDAKARKKDLEERKQIIIDFVKQQRSESEQLKEFALAHDAVAAAKYRLTKAEEMYNKAMRHGGDIAKEYQAMWPRIKRNYEEQIELAEKEAVNLDRLNRSRNAQLQLNAAVVNTIQSASSGMPLSMVAMQQVPQFLGAFIQESSKFEQFVNFLISPKGLVGVGAAISALLPVMASFQQALQFRDVQNSVRGVSTDVKALATDITIAARAAAASGSGSTGEFTTAGQTFARAGLFNQRNADQLMRVTRAMAAQSNQTIEESAQNLSEKLISPTESAFKLMAEGNTVITEELVAQIRLMEQQNKLTEARELLLNGIDLSLKGAGDYLGVFTKTVDQGLYSIGSAWRWLGDAMNDQSFVEPVNRLAEVHKRIVDLRNLSTQYPRQAGAYNIELNKLVEEEKTLKNTIKERAILYAQEEQRRKRQSDIAKVYQATENMPQVQLQAIQEQIKLYEGLQSQYSATSDAGLRLRLMLEKLRIEANNLESPFAAQERQLRNNVTALKERREYTRELVQFQQQMAELERKNVADPVARAGAEEAWKQGKGEEFNQGLFNLQERIKEQRALNETIGQGTVAFSRIKNAIDAYNDALGNFEEGSPEFIAKMMEKFRLLQELSKVNREGQTGYNIDQGQMQIRLLEGQLGLVGQIATVRERSAFEEQKREELKRNGSTNAEKELAIAMELYDIQRKLNKELEQKRLLQDLQDSIDVMVKPEGFGRTLEQYRLSLKRMVEDGKIGIESMDSAMEKFGERLRLVFQNNTSMLRLQTQLQEDYNRALKGQQLPIPAPAAPAAPGNSNIGGGNSSRDRHIAEAARDFGIDENTIRSMIRVESGGKANAVSSANAKGLMQLLPGTFADMQRKYGIEGDIFDERSNIRAGTAYLRDMREKFGTDGMFKAYNWGPGKYGEYLAGKRAIPKEVESYDQNVRSGAGNIVAGTNGPSVQNLHEMFLRLKADNPFAELTGQLSAYRREAELTEIQSRAFMDVLRDGESLDNFEKFTEAWKERVKILVQANDKQRENNFLNEMTQIQSDIDIARYEDSLAGKGNKEKNRLLAEKRYEIGLRNQGNWTPEQVKQMTEAYKELLDVQESLANPGVFDSLAAAMKNYGDEVMDVGKGLESVWSNVTSSMEDSFVQFIQTGKADFKSLTDSIVSDILRMVVRTSITGPLNSALGNIFGGLGNSLGGIFGGLFGGGGAAGANVSKSAAGSLANSGGSFFSGIKIFHDGGIVGMGGAGSRMVPESIFANAPRFHNGNVPWLNPDEQAAILKRGEIVLPEHTRSMMGVSGKGNSGNKGGDFYYIDAKGSNDPAATEQAIERAMMRHRPALIRDAANVAQDRVVNRYHSLGGRL